jgi:hypothetical protein
MKRENMNVYKYGISMMLEGEGEEFFPDVEALLSDKRFDVFEINGESFDKIIKKNTIPDSLISIKNFISPLDFRNLIAQKDSIQNNFLLKFAENAAELRKTKLKFVGIDFSVEYCVGDMFYYNDVLMLLRKIARILLPLEICLCLPVRIPRDTNDPDASFYRKILADLMLPNCALAPEIFPHKLAGKEEMSVFVKPYRLDSALLRVKYDLKSGNVITEKIISQISAALDLFPSSKPCFFDPMIRDNKALPAEAEKILKILDKFYKK